MAAFPSVIHWMSWGGEMGWFGLYSCFARSVASSSSFSFFFFFFFFYTENQCDFVSIQSESAQGDGSNLFLSFFLSFYLDGLNQLSKKCSHPVGQRLLSAPVCGQR